MKDFFPIMNDDTEKGMHFALFAYWILAFWFFPFWMPLIGDGFWDNYPVITWFEIVYHALNTLVVAIMMKDYLKDSLLNVQMEPKKFILIVGSAALVMLALAAVLRYFLGEVMIDFYPISEMDVAFSSGYLVAQQPIFGTLCYSLFTPITVVGLFYASGFAPVCRRSRWLGYLVVTVVLALPCAFDILWRGEADFMVALFILRLPMHWIACWTYQKADTVWAPVATLTVFNLGTSLMALI